MSIEESVRLKFSIERFDLHYSNINNKNSVILGLSTFMVGGLLALYPYFLNHLEFTQFWKIYYLVSILIGIVAVIILILSSIPYLKPGENSVNSFVSIHHMGEKKFAKKSEEINSAEYLNDLRIQTYILAEGLYIKYSRIKTACIILTIQFAILIPLFLTLFINHKN